MRLAASVGGSSRPRSIFSARARYRLLCCFATGLAPFGLSGLPSIARWAPAVRGKNTILAANLHAHAPRGAFYHPHRGLDRIRVEVVHLDLGDRAHLRASDLPHLVLVRLARALLDAGFLSDEVGRGGALRDERVGPVLEDRHHRGHDGAGERRGALVVLLDELAHVDAVRAERRTDR